MTDFTALASDTLSRIEAREPALHAWAHLDRDVVLAEAKRMDDHRVTGPLAGYSVGIKDIFDTADFPTECGSRIHAGRRPGRDAAAVAAVRRAGGLVVGKTVTTEFAFVTPGPTVNPHDPSRTPGGSSSGSAASVAANGVDMALGTQTAGSIIRPAAFCGVVGIKPSFGMISRSGLGLFSESLDTIGGFARDVQGVARLVGAMAGRPDLICAEAAADAPRFALYRTPDADLCEPAALQALDILGHVARDAGAIVEDLPDTLPWADLLSGQKTIMAHEGARALLDEWTRHADQLSPALRDYIGEGLAVDGLARLKAAGAVQAGRAILDATMRDADMVLTLSTRGEAPRLADGTGDAHFNRVWTALGCPALHLPTTAGPNGLPLGVQLVARPGADRSLVAAALWLEARLPCHS